MNLKVAIQSSIIACILGAFSYHLFFNKKGIKNYLAIKKQHHVEKIEIAALTEEIQKLTCALKDWQENPFAREKAAREDLHMTYPNERIYFIKPISKVENNA